MNRWLKKLHRRKDPPGLELRLLRRMPAILLLGTLLPLGLSVLARWWLGGDAIRQIRSIDIFAIASAVSVWTAAFTASVACFIVFVMKGPAYVADGYALNDASRPRR